LIIRTLLLALTVVLVILGPTFAGSPAGPLPLGPAPDLELMAFKDQGVWYFPCAAPAFPVRIGFQELSYGPPPPCFGVAGYGAVPGVRSRVGGGPRFAGPPIEGPFGKAKKAGR
jgi:hypothetical protein